MLRSPLNSISVFSSRSSLRFKRFPLECLVVDSSLIRKKEKLIEMATRCHSLSLDVPLVSLFINDRCLHNTVSLHWNALLFSIFIVNKNSCLTSFWRILLVSFWNLFKVYKLYDIRYSENIDSKPWTLSMLFSYLKDFCVRNDYMRKQ